MMMFIASIIICSAEFDFEIRSVYNLLLQVEDNSRISPRQSDPSTVTINIQNIDDEPTVFDQSQYSKFELMYYIIS